MSEQEKRKGTVYASATYRVRIGEYMGRTERYATECAQVFRVHLAPMEA